MIAASWWALLQFGKFLPAALLAVCSAAALTALALRTPMIPGSSVAILFSPDTPLLDAFSTVGRLGGHVERTGRWNNILVATFPGQKPPVDALASSGAWLVFNAIAAGGCDTDVPAIKIQASQAIRTQNSERRES